MQAKQSSTIPVYQALSHTEKVTNQTARPDLVYSSLTTFDLLLRQVRKDGFGIIFSSTAHAVHATRKLLSRKEVFVAEQWDGNTLSQLPRGVKVLVISFKPGTTIKVSDLELVVKCLGLSAADLKWISILQQPAPNQLFKWELKYRNN